MCPTPEKILPSSSLHWKPTPKQVRAITKLTQQLDIFYPLESEPRTRKEARDLIYSLRMRLKEKNEIQ